MGGGSLFSAVLCAFIAQCMCFLYEDPSQPFNPATTKKVHEFNFHLTWELSMLYTDTNDVQWNVTLEDGRLYYAPNGTRIYLDPNDVNTLDGFQTKYIAINGQMPGPTIEVPLGSTVYVHVTNGLRTDAATIHWHGLAQRNTQWSDGAPFITQCPILPDTSYTYKFVADEAGTFWYHSHLDMQKSDGLLGAIIVHDVTRATYPEFTVLIQDWLHMDSDQFGTTLYGPGDPIAVYADIPDRYNNIADDDVGDLISSSFLVNGRGIFNGNSAPLTVHRVKSGGQYMFRFINVGYDNLYEVSIDNHLMSVVGVDSGEVEPILVDSVFLAVGERVNVVVDALQPDENYWIRFRSPYKSQKLLGYSILSYTTSNHDPMTKPKNCTLENPCTALNCPFESDVGWTCVSIDALESADYHTAEINKIRSSDNVSEHFFAYSYMAGDSINGRGLKLPSSPFYQESYTKTGIHCDTNTCNSVGCKCTHVYPLPSNRVVQLVVMNPVLKHFTHTFHMHGYRFAVLKVVYPPKDEKTGLITTTLNRDLACSNAFCYDARWINSTTGEFKVNRPPLKDTVFVPVGGYVVLRLYTDNPGYWMAHCHQSEHLHEGMGMVFDVDGETAKGNIPDGFPKCGNFVLKPDSQ